MANLFSTGRIIDYILILVLVEAAAWIWLTKRLGHGIPPAQVIANLGAGAALLLAVQAAIVHRPWPGIAAWLLVALGAHACEMSLRWGAQFKRRSVRVRTRR